MCTISLRLQHFSVPEKCSMGNSNVFSIQKICCTTHPQILERHVPHFNHYLRKILINFYLNKQIHMLYKKQTHESDPFFDHISGITRQILLILASKSKNFIRHIQKQINRNRWRFTILRNKIQQSLFVYPSLLHYDSFIKPRKTCEV